MIEQTLHTINGSFKSLIILPKSGIFKASTCLDVEHGNVMSERSKSSMSMSSLFISSRIFSSSSSNILEIFILFCNKSNVMIMVKS